MNAPTQRPRQNYSYTPTLRRPPLKRPQPSRHHRGRKLLAVAVVLLITAGIIYKLVPRSTTDLKHVSSAVFTPPAPTVIMPTPVANPNIPAMANTINGIISANSNIDMSVSLIDLSNDQAEHYGDTAAFTAASTTKVITAADFLQQVQDGQESLTETINGSTAEYEIQQMIVISDDNAWAALNTELGYSQLQSYAATIGAPSFQSVPNTVTSDDMAQVMAKLYEGKLLNASNTQLLLGYLKQANYRTYIVPAVPAGDTIYHKIGLYEDNVHDEAIITNGSKAFVIVIFTNGNGVYNWPARAQIMQQITQAALAVYF
jgi:beta-lactamase class A